MGDGVATSLILHQLWRTGIPEAWLYVAKIAQVVRILLN